MNSKYRTLTLDVYGTEQSVAIYANNDEDRPRHRDTGDVVVYITAAGFSCSMHVTPDVARQMALLLTLAAEEATPVAEVA